MREKYLLHFALALGLSGFGLSPAMAQNDAATILQKLKIDKPKVNWNEKSLTSADVTCNGLPDHLMLGQEKDKVWLAVVDGSKNNQLGQLRTYSFGVNSSSQESVCQLPVRIEIRPLVCDSEDGNLQGCKPSKACKSFALMDDACDSINFYWDSQHKKLVHWRN